MPNRRVPVTAGGLPNPDQQPDDDLASAMSMMRVSMTILEEGARRGLSTGECLDLLVVLEHSLSALRPILRLLNGADFPEMMDRYRAARIAA